MANSDLAINFKFSHHPWIWGRFVIPKSAWEGTFVSEILKELTTLSGREVVVESVEMDINSTPVLVIWYDVEPRPLSRVICDMVSQYIAKYYDVQITSWWEQSGDFTRFSVWTPLPDEYVIYLKAVDEEWIEDSRMRERL